MRSMKALKLLFCAGLISLAGRLPAADTAAPSEPPPPVPADVQLRNGAVLHRVTVLRWEKDRVILKHAGGADPVRYVDIADSQKAAIMARGEYEMAHPAAPRQSALPAATPVDANAIVYKGTVSVPTVINRDVKSPYGSMSSSGVYKFAGVTVYAFPLSALAAFDGERDPVDLPKPLASAVTDAEGAFTLTVPAGAPHFLFCEAQRSVTGGNENCAWRVQAKDIKNPTGLDFSTHYRVTYRQLRIAE
ncbi:MAG TPA: hypothetical protein VG838_09725 [Opitutaceae bacterium]|nr:hypothetical protein [Opitutaceae bacterium]